MFHLVSSYRVISFATQVKNDITIVLDTQRRSFSFVENTIRLNRLRIFMQIPIFIDVIKQIEFN